MNMKKKKYNVLNVSVEVTSSAALAYWKVTRF